jgi:hypothetical protein
LFSAGAVNFHLSINLILKNPVFSNQSEDEATLCQFFGKIQGVLTNLEWTTSSDTGIDQLVITLTLDPQSVAPQKVWVDLEILTEGTSEVPMQKLKYFEEYTLSSDQPEGRFSLELGRYKEVRLTAGTRLTQPPELAEMKSVDLLAVITAH